MFTQKLKGETKVWDIFIRFFHWSLAFSFFVVYLTGDDENIWHIYFGYTIGILLLLRIIWGFVGSKYARFSNFIYSPNTVVAYIKSLLYLTPKHYLGHNPAAGYMVLALLFLLTITTITGLKAYGLEGKGPFAGGSNISLISTAFADDDEHEEDESHSKRDKEDDFWEEVHESAANVTILFIFLHIIGVYVSGRLHKENLVKAMITGKK